MAATQDIALTRESVQVASRNSIPAKASATIYQDTFVGLSAGYARGLVKGDKFVGIATRKVDNSAGAAGALEVEVETGAIVHLNVTGVTAVTDVGAIVYASDDQTATLTAADNVAIGVVRRFISGTKCAVRLFTEAEVALV